ncbi:phosphatidylinositol 4-phosphate 5-kinase 9 [Physcomitrium patens]|uniref:1-phosphatidylinositol-4-phosphate 5-kinase n=2 Tax=Physcomitrium patens TaxID=3218 RepID=A0A2K1JVK6_PHYPA|nr:phosphatidylinositol 4-phosphate 5-kinase 9-like [Physcomitrium patens]PNR45552.1 hypothetical protein PHYPA_015323 [Physcomitrium patens]|eukprot:XP_024388541.1 phosphatidylinositol 4-phosphate 5-kinase 9-like [Physcomitrella patens]
MSEGLNETHGTKEFSMRSPASRGADSCAAALVTCSLGRTEEGNVADYSGQGIRSSIFNFQRRSRKRAVAPEKAVSPGLTCMSEPLPQGDTANDVDLPKQSIGKHYSPRSCELPSIKSLVSDDDGEAKRTAPLDGLEDVGLDSVTGEKVLSNGDFYVGTWQGSLPEGPGKYLWADGCMYEGEWGRGKKSGQGKISWPSGATYEGEFMGGYMHGFGTYMGTGGTTYKGQWSMNDKHGQGRKRYANGDVYEGAWYKGVHEGVGKYTWASGNEYNGEWRGGTMCGKGVLTWVSGDKFVGQWLDGLEHGRGVYVWADGSSYIGTWSRGLKDGKGVFYPAGTRDLQATRNSDVGGVSSCAHFSGELRPLRWSRSRSTSSEKIPHFGELSRSGDLTNSIQRRWSIDGPAEKGLGLEGYGSVRNSDTILEDVERGSDRKPLESVGTLPPTVVVREYVQGVLMSELVKENAEAVGHKKRRPRRSAREIKRPGETIFKGHRSYDLMLNLQLGIRYTIGKITPEPRHEIGPNDFGPRASIHMNFPKAGTPMTPIHSSSDFKWKDYCPMVFRHLREMFKIDAADYMISLTGDDALRELVSPGKSGSVFYLSHDDRFIIKTMKKAEVKVLLSMLAAYHSHVKTYENTLITKIFGLHRIKPYGGQKVRFVVMGNMFCTELRIHRRFDLKGSSQGRSADKVEIDETTTLKDLDLKYEFRLDPSWRDSLLRQLEYDCKFLESRGIMDYSMLLGLHFRAPQYRTLLTPGASSARDVPPNESFTSTNLDEGGDEEWASNRGLMLVTRDASNVSSGTPGIHIRGSPLRASVAGDPEVDLLLPGTARLRIQLGVNMPARAECVHKKDSDESKPSEGQLFEESHDVVLYFGIIDILQNYNLSKRIEHAYKACQFDSISISAVEPKLYSKRFQEFIRQIFPPTHLNE